MLRIPGALSFSWLSSIPLSGGTIACIPSPTEGHAHRVHAHDIKRLRIFPYSCVCGQVSITPGKYQGGELLGRISVYVSLDKKLPNFAEAAVSFCIPTDRAGTFQLLRGLPSTCRERTTVKAQHPRQSFQLQGQSPPRPSPPGHPTAPNSPPVPACSPPSLPLPPPNTQQVLCPS